MPFSSELNDKVRDYELDMQGVVNNSCYFNYCEHARHEFFLEHGIDFAELARQKINLVVIEALGKYTTSLTSGDQYIVRTRLEKKGRVKFLFIQTIHRQSDNQLAFTGQFTCTTLNERGRPFMPKSIQALISPQ